MLEGLTRLVRLLAWAAFGAACIVAVLYVPGHLATAVGVDHQAGNFSRAEFVSVILTAVTVVLAALAIILAIAAVSGYTQIKKDATKVAEKAAKVAAKREAANVARSTATEVATRVVLEQTSPGGDYGNAAGGGYDDE